MALSESSDLLGLDLPDQTPYYLKLENQLWLNPGYWHDHLSPLVGRIKSDPGESLTFCDYLMDFLNSSAQMGLQYALPIYRMYGTYLKMVLDEVGSEEGRDEFLSNLADGRRSLPEDGKDQLIHLAETLATWSLNFRGNKLKLRELASMDTTRMGSIFRSFIEIQDIYLGLYNQNEVFRKPESRLEVVRDPVFWSMDYSYYALLEWLSLITDPKYWLMHDDQPLGIFVHDQEYPGNIPRMFYSSHSGKHKFEHWLTAYSGRVVYFDWSEKTKESKGWAWDEKIRRGIDRDPWLVDEARKEFFIDWMIELIKSNTHTIDQHAEMGGGAGLLSRKLNQIHPKARHTVLDVSPMAMENAHAQGFSTVVADLDIECPVEGTCQAISCLDVAHWLNQGELDSIFRRWGNKVKEGVMVVNVYPPSPRQAKYYLEQAIRAGLKNAYIDEKLFKRGNIAVNKYWPDERMEYVLVVPIY